MYVLTSAKFLFLCVILCLEFLLTVSNGCGYETCNLGDPTKLNVHIIAHTHDDVGWIKTVDQYYYGARNFIQHAGVQYIIDSVMRALDQNPDRRFIYVEQAYFWRWWSEQTDDMRNKVRGFINDSRLEFISGGWCMNDEATTHYSSIIDQHSLGAEFLRDQFGECGRPKIGWQIDPFGHSREYASLIAQMGFDGLFFARADYQDYEQRNRTKTMEMVWKASANLDRQSWLFTSILPNGYGPPHSFCFDSNCADPPIMDNPRSYIYNVPERVQTFIEIAQYEASAYATNHVIVSMGSDFHFENADETFKNIDKLIKYVNTEQVNGSNVNAFYSTPSCYLYALNKAEREWTSKTDDFFPYANEAHAFWTGYFTSRPALKYYERYSNNILQVTRQLNTFANTSLRDSLFPLNDAMGIVQHHDAVSGTARQEVTDDYAVRLSDGIATAETIISTVYAKLLPKTSQSPPATPHFLCQLSNISECLPLEEQDRFTLTIWNPTIHSVSQHFRVPVTRSYSVRDPTGEVIFSELIPISNFTMKIPGRNSTATNQLIFQGTLPPLGFNTYYFEAKSDEESKVKITENDACVLQNQNIRVEIDAQGNLQRIINLKTNISVTFFNQSFYWYQSFVGNNSIPEAQTSGAYIFRPYRPIPKPVATTRTLICMKAETVQTAIISFSNWTSQEISLYNDGEVVEVEWTVGAIAIDDLVGKEVIIRYDTDIQSESKYYTDANGREVLERIRDYRPTWNLTVTENVSGNYYPINSRIWIKDQTRQFTILTGDPLDAVNELQHNSCSAWTLALSLNRSQGGSSISDGSLEIMVHRRVLHDDARGVNEHLNEVAYGEGLVVRGRHILIVQSPALSARYHRVLSQQLYMHPMSTYSLIQQTYDQYSDEYRQTWSALQDILPLNVHLLTLDQLGPKDYRVRVENYFELYEDDTYSQPVIVDLQSIFRSIGLISNMVELTLNADLALSHLQRLDWMTNDKESSYIPPYNQTSLKDTNVRLTPMQIRTFQVTVT